jgi:hypothetical protein
LQVQKPLCDRIKEICHAQQPPPPLEFRDPPASAAGNRRSRSGGGGGSGGGDSGGGGGASTARAVCGEAPAKLLSCSRCRAVRYCGAACQKLHWKSGGLKSECVAWVVEVEG